jgi:3',5'-cyclic AMP phosphodiesterase CpdA
VRVAHATDIHWFVPPRAGQMTVKRLLGSANLYLRGRRHDFDEGVQSALVDHLVDLEPDLVIVTGDLTAQATPEEFDKARQALAPVLDTLETFVIPGNHDVYTPGALRERRIERYFGPWMGLDDSPIGRRDLGPVTVLGLDPNRPTLVTASGVVPEEQLVALDEALRDPALASRFVILALHYPILDRRGEVYDGANHGLRNARELIALLDRAPTRPAIILCGHKHHGFRSDLELSDGAVIPVVNCGSSGYAFQPDHQRAAAMCVYEIDDDGRLASVERFLYDGGGFAPEPGGPFATGR